MPASTGMSGFGTSVCWNAMEQNRVWLPGTTWVDQYALVHELGHNLGLMHAQGYDSNGQLAEYGDGSCPMGSGTSMPTHYSAPSSMALGWTTPQAELRDDDLPVGVWKSFMLRGLADAPVSGLRVLPASWTFGANGWTGYDQIVVSFRRATDTNMDAGLQPPYRNKVQVHSYEASQTCPHSVLLSTLDAGGVWPKPGSSLPADTQSPGLV
eukprot:XP_001697280.1 predicted protein [Chlamydomonas reinhardtii]